MHIQIILKYLKTFGKWKIKKSNKSKNDVFRLILENCQACNDGECTMDSLDIIQNACSDNLSLSSHMSMPLSTSAEVNQYINTINSDYSYQLAELTLFQFPNTTEWVKTTITFSNNKSLVTIACDIALRPRQAIDAYNPRLVSKILDFA